MKTPKNNEYIICLLDLMNNRQQTGIFFISSHLSLEGISHKFGYSVFKKILGLRWEIHISHMLQAGSQRYKLAPPTKNTSIVNIIKRVRDRIISEGLDNSKVIMLPSNNPLKDNCDAANEWFRARNLPPIGD